MELLNVYLAQAWDGFLVYAVAFVLVLSVLVFVHEWGHYIVAKLCGVRITTFSIGFGKELFGWNDKSGTRWRLAALPLGGYVQMFGDADPSSSVQDEGAKTLTAEEKKVAFFYKPLWQRAMIVFAGPGINFLFAIVLLFGVYVTSGQRVTPPVISAVVKDSPADKAGLMPYDHVLEINNVKIKRFEDIQREIMVLLDTPSQIKVDRDGEILTFKGVVPERMELEDRFGFKQSRGILGVVGPSQGIDLDTVTKINGIALSTLQEKRQAILKNIDRTVTLQFGADDAEPKPTILVVHPPRVLNEDFLKDSTSKTLALVNLGEEDSIIRHTMVSGLQTAVSETGSVVAKTFQALGQMVSGVRGPDELGGIVRIGAIAGDAFQAEGWIPLLTFTALLSINLGLINLFPIPVLDGGHLMFYAIEAIKGSPISENMQNYAYKFGLFLLIGLMVFANLNDLVQLIF